MIIDENSPLRRLPGNLERAQLLFLDAIRFSIEMIELSYFRLKQHLLEVSCLEENPPNHPTALPPYAFSNALLDAWSIIDSIHRLRRLVGNVPMGKRPEYVEQFLTSVQTISDLRGHFHHFDEHINRRKMSRDQPVLGRISWVVFVKSTDPTLRTYILIPGTMMNSAHRMINPCGQHIRPPIDLITIEAHDAIINISQHVDRVIEFAKLFQESVKKSIGKFAQAGGDALISADCIFPSTGT